MAREWNEHELLMLGGDMVPPRSEWARSYDEHGCEVLTCEVPDGVLWFRRAKPEVSS